VTPVRSAPTVSVLALLLVAGCASGPDVDVPDLDVPSTIEVTSPSFADGEPLAASETCVGEGAFPAIEWANLPDGTESVAVVVHDADAKGGDYVHRLTTNLDPAAGSLPGAETPPGAVEYETSNGAPGWTPPCPPSGSGTHRYVFTVLALDRPTRIPTTAKTQNVLLTVGEAAFAQGAITGTVTAD
jgi:Raf kinase inhibitor-like YbhB/YbcL family protein